MAAAKGIIMATDSSLLVEFGGHIAINCHWAYHLLDRTKFSRRKVTTAKTKASPLELQEQIFLKKLWLS